LAQAMAFFLLVIARALGQDWGFTELDIFFCSFNFWLWWASGGDDDLKKGGRELARVMKILTVRRKARADG